MITMRVTVKDNTDSKGKASRLRQGMLDANRDLAEFIRDRAQFYAPFKTGKLERNIIVKFVDKGKFTITSMAPYSGYQEYGVAPNRSYGFIPWKGKGRSGEGFMERRGYKTHPGITPKKFMQRAGEDGRREVKKIYGRRIQLAIRRNT